MEFTIYRDSWRRGGEQNHPEHGETLLLNKQGMMCCLGQCGASLGAPAKHLYDLGSPEELPDTPVLRGVVGVFVEEDDWANTALADKAILINDNEAYTDSERETKLIELFARYGHTIQFVDGKAPESWTKVSA